MCFPENAACLKSYTHTAAGPACDLFPRSGNQRGLLVQILWHVCKSVNGGPRDLMG